MNKVGWIYMIALMCFFMLLGGAALILHSATPIYLLLIICGIKLFILIFFGPNHYPDNEPEN